MNIRISHFKFQIISLLIFFQTILGQNPIIVIPFKINRIPNTKSSEFDITHFFQEYFFRDFYTSLPTGIPSKKILALLDTHSHIFHFGENYLKKNSLNEILDSEKIISKQTYDKTESLSFKNISRFHYSNRELKTASLCSEIFILYTDILMEKFVSIGDVKFIIDDDVQENLHIRIGLGKPLTKDYVGPPHFIQSLLDVNAIKDQTWTIKFNKNGGLFILGEEPHKYEDITLDKRYQRKNYFITESLSSVEYHNPISIKVQDVYLINNKNKNKKEEITINEDKGCYLNYNNGFITATKEYWDYIKKNFFNEFFNSNICKEELIKFNLEEDIVKSYYVISCDKSKFTEEDKIKLDEFPTIIFYIFDYNYKFELTKDDVFTEVNNILYFMIIYKRDIFNNPDLVFWDLGLPFLQKYQFVHNYEKKTIGFYLPEKEEEIEEPLQSENNEEKQSDININPNENKNGNDMNKNKNKDDNDNDKDKNNNLAIYIIIGIIVGILLLILAFCLGKNLYQQRKRKANELEENFDYTSSNNKTKDKDEEGTIN
mgnify:FL=1